MADALLDNAEVDDERAFNAQVFGTINNAIAGATTYFTAREQAKIVSNAKPANLGILVGGVVVVGILIVLVAKHH